MKYTITIEETVSDSFIIEADNLKQALQIAQNKYYDSEIILEPGNLLNTKMQISNDDLDEQTDWIDL